jgi:hypothetical protein
MLVKNISIVFSASLLIAAALLYGLNLGLPQICEYPGKFGQFNLCQDSFLVLLPLFTLMPFLFFLFFVKEAVLRSWYKVAFILAFVGSFLVLMSPDRAYSLFPVDKTRISLLVSTIIFSVLFIFTFFKTIQIYRKKK